MVFLAREEEEDEIQTLEVDVDAVDIAEVEVEGALPPAIMDPDRSEGTTRPGWRIGSKRSEYAMK